MTIVELIYSFKSWLSYFLELYQLLQASLQNKLGTYLETCLYKEISF